MELHEAAIVAEAQPYLTSIALRGPYAFSPLGRTAIALMIHQAARFFVFCYRLHLIEQHEANRYSYRGGQSEG